VIQVCLAYVDAQRELRHKGSKQGRLLEYAQKFRSCPGEGRPVLGGQEGEPPSPLGPLDGTVRQSGVNKTDPRGSQLRTTGTTSDPHSQERMREGGPTITCKGGR